jgi:hypothetical protein
VDDEEDVVEVELSSADVVALAVESSEIVVDELLST